MPKMLRCPLDQCTQCIEVYIVFVFFRSVCLRVYGNRIPRCLEVWSMELVETFISDGVKLGRVLIALLL